MDMRTKVDKVRETALKILYDINEKGAYSNISLNKYLLLAAWPYFAASFTLSLHAAKKGILSV